MSFKSDLTAKSSNDEQISNYKNPEWLDEQYWDRELSLVEVGNQAGVSAKTVLNWMKEFGIPRRKPNIEKPPHLREMDSGYMQMLTTNPDGKLDSVLIHRLVAVAEYGIDAVKDKHVHHKNHHKFDNRPKNLVPLSPAEHAAEHSVGRKRDENGAFVADD